VRVLKKEDKSRLSLIKFGQFFTHISGPRCNFKKLVGSFFGINMRSHCAKFQPSVALKLRQEIEDERWTYCKNVKFQTTPNGTKNIIIDFFLNFLSRFA